MTLYESLLTVFILGMIFILGYLKMKDKTFSEFFQEIRDVFTGRTEDLDLKW